MNTHIHTTCPKLHFIIQCPCNLAANYVHLTMFYSQEWRTWAACFIQVAWRRHCRNKLEKSLREEEDKLQATLAKESTNAPSLGATIYASRFAANMLCALRRNNTTGTKSSPTLPLLLHKPAEPDFSEKI